MFMLRHGNNSEKLRWVLELAGEEFHEARDKGTPFRVLFESRTTVHW